MISKRKNVAPSILESLVDFAESIADLAFSRKAAYRFLYDRTGNNLSKKQISRQFRDLEKNGYLKTDVGSCSVEFTAKAKLKSLEKLTEKASPDGKNRFVSFDIPEQMRAKRNLFRGAIKKMGFKQIQKSLWVSDKNIGDLVEIAAYEYGVEKYIVYIVAEKTDIDGVIQKILHEKIS